MDSGLFWGVRAWIWAYCGDRAWIFAYFGVSRLGFRPIFRGPSLDLGQFGGSDLDLGLFWEIRPGFGPILGDPAWNWTYFGEVQWTRAY